MSEGTTAEEPAWYHPRRVFRRGRRRPPIIGELVIMLMLLKVYDYVRGFAALRSGKARDHGEDVMSAEQFLHIDIEKPLNHWLSLHDVLENVAAYWYQYAHVLGTMTVLIWCYVAAPVLYRRARNALVITNVVGMTVFFFLPVMPPRLLPDWGFVDSLAAAGFQSAHYGSVKPDEYAAMPSLHLSWAVWTALVGAALLWRFRWRWLWLLYPFTTATVVVTTANHYVLDVVAGVAVALAATWATGQLDPSSRVPLGWWRWRPVAAYGVTGLAAFGSLFRTTYPYGSPEAAFPAAEIVTSDDPAAEQEREDGRAGKQRQPDGEQPVSHHGG